MLLCRVYVVIRLRRFIPGACVYAKCALCTAASAAAASSWARRLATSFRWAAQYLGVGTTEPNNNNNKTYHHCYQYIGSVQLSQTWVYTACLLLLFIYHESCYIWLAWLAWLAPKFTVWGMRGWNAETPNALKRLIALKRLMAVCFLCLRSPTP